MERWTPEQSPPRVCVVLGDGREMWIDWDGAILLIDDGGETSFIKSRWIRMRGTK